MRLKFSLLVVLALAGAAGLVQAQQAPAPQPSSPVPGPVGSPPWIMKPGMTRWNVVPS